MPAVELTLAILNTLVQLQPEAQAAMPVMRKAIMGQDVSDAELQTLAQSAASLNAQAAVLAKQ